MRILWFTNILMPEASSYLQRPNARVGGWWMSALLERLKRRNGIRLAVVTSDVSQEKHFEVDGVEYFVVKGPWYGALQARLGSLRPVSPSPCRISKYASIVERWNPDVVHVHGTEGDYGLLKSRGRTDKPVVVSIQGVMASCARKVCGDLLPREVDGVVRSAIEYKAFSLNLWKSLRAKASTEEEILGSVDMVLGRTEWDRTWVWALNPQARYRHVEELMRPQFFGAQAWELRGCRRHQIFCTSGAQPLKGLHVLVEAVSKLHKLYPGIRLHIASGGFVPQPENAYARFILRMVNRLGLQDAVSFLGWIDPREQVEQLQQAHCFVTPSFIENSCNALQEAMLIGTPSIATSSGGLLTMIEAERSGLSFPSGDVAMLAHGMHRLFCDDALASSLGAEARVVARSRNDPERVERQLIEAYEEAIATASRARAGEKALA